MNALKNELMEQRRGRLEYILLVALASVCWVALRFEYLKQFEPATLARIYDFTAAVPFGKRVLMACLAHVFGWAGLSIPHTFQILDVAATMALVAGLVRLFREHVGIRTARLLGFGIFMVLPYLFFAPSLNGTIDLMPWDMPAWAFTAWGLHWALKGRWKTIAALMVCASLNRESAVLLPLVWLAVRSERAPLWRTLGVVGLLCAIYAGCQMVVASTLADNVEYYDLRWGMSLNVAGTWRLLNNWHWLTAFAQRPVVLLGTMAMLPAAFIWQLRRIPAVFRRAVLAGWFYFCMLMVVGNIYEARIYGEISVLMYVPVALRAWECISGENVFEGFAVAGETNWLAPWMKWLEWMAFIVPPLGVMALGWGLSHGFG